ncbi:MAG: carbon starvation protein A [Phycisphaerae bacterium]|jgi:carbon starvation protein
MKTLLLMLVCGGGYIIAYYTYGRYLARKIFKLSVNAVVPSRKFRDNIDYVPTRKSILFGHHYTSIAGTGPIVGPAIGVIWGWLPAILWVTFGSILMGAVHDFGSLVVSLRNEGKSISEISSRYINKRVRLIFFFVVFLTLLIVIAIFGLVIALVFDQFPQSILPVWLQIPIAIGLGWFIYKRNGNIFLSTLVSVIALYATILLGGWLQTVKPDLLTIPNFANMPATGTWTIILLIYAWIASTLPVTMLLQPRDYINAWQLFIAMGLLVFGVIAATAKSSLEIVAPAVNTSLPADTPSLWPFLFITIACGAISGFHSLVASGTSPKQLSNERDAQFIGYGSMLLEGFLAVLVIICVCAGVGLAFKTPDGTILSGKAAWMYHYSSWGTLTGGLRAQLDAFIQGASHIIAAIKIPQFIGSALMGVFVASFAGTTLDTATRIQRYVISELANDLGMKKLSNRWIATTIAVLTAAGLAFATGANGAGAKMLRPMFGTANQLLAALALLVVTMYLHKKGGWKFILAGVPALIMLAVTFSALVIQIKQYIPLLDTQPKEYWPLVALGIALFGLAIWMTVETVIVFIKTPAPRQETATAQARSGQCRPVD